MNIKLIRFNHNHDEHGDYELAALEATVKLLNARKMRIHLCLKYMWHRN